MVLVLRLGEYNAALFVFDWLLLSDFLRLYAALCRREEIMSMFSLLRKFNASSVWSSRDDRVRIDLHVIKWFLHKSWVPSSLCLSGGSVLHLTAALRPPPIWKFWDNRKADIELIKRELAGTKRLMLVNPTSELPLNTLLECFPSAESIEVLSGLDRFDISPLKLAFCLPASHAHLKSLDVMSCSGFTEASISQICRQSSRLETLRVHWKARAGRTLLSMLVTHCRLLSTLEVRLNGSERRSALPLLALHCHTHFKSLGLNFMSTRDLRCLLWYRGRGLGTLNLVACSDLTERLDGVLLETGVQLRKLSVDSYWAPIQSKCLVDLEMWDFVGNSRLLLTSNRGLRRLKLVRTKDLQSSCFADLPCLDTLELVNCLLFPDTINAICVLCPTVTSLNVSYNFLSPAILPGLAALTQLKELNVYSNYWQSFKSFDPCPLPCSLSILVSGSNWLAPGLLRYIFTSCRITTFNLLMGNDALLAEEVLFEKGLQHLENVYLSHLLIAPATLKRLVRLSPRLRYARVCTTERVARQIQKSARRGHQLLVEGIMEQGKLPHAELLNGMWPRD